MFKENTLGERIPYSPEPRRIHIERDETDNSLARALALAFLRLQRDTAQKRRTLPPHHDGRVIRQSS